MIKIKSNGKRFIKLLILIIMLLFFIRTITITLSKYESISKSELGLDIAFYVINNNYQTMNLNLETLVPRNEPYIYNFSVSNEEKGKRAETDMEYNLNIVATTNLPLRYELYLNEAHNEQGATNIIKTDITELDEDGTYFKTISTNTEYFEHTKSKTNTYQLIVYFPSIYNSISYKDIIESIDITVDSKQVI